MVERIFVLGSATGLHARPAAQLVQTVRRFPGTEVVLRHADREANALSLLSLISLGAGAGAEVIVRCEGPQAEEAMAALACLLEGESRTPAPE